MTKKILELVRQRPRYGYRRIAVLLRRDGEVINDKRMHRLWKAAGLKVPRKRRKKRARAIRRMLVTWCQLGVDVLYIEPGSPWQNGLFESFNSKLRDEYLHQTDLLNESATRIKARAWQEDFNNHRPHRSLGYLTPADFTNRCAASVPLAALTPRNQHSDTPEPLPVSQPDL